MKNKLILVLAFLWVFNISFCFIVKAEGNPVPPNPVKQAVLVNTIVLEESAKTIEIGKSIIINAIISPLDATNKEVIWSTSDDKVVAVDNKGVITALVQGVARITVKTVDGAKEAVCDVTVVGHKGWITENGKWYYYDYETSRKKTGWLPINGSWYYLDLGGVMKTGWQQVNGSWYYLNESGVMATGWKLDKTDWYYLNSSGIMVTGWKQAEDKWYYLGPNGIMKTGWELYNGSWYYLYSSGEMAINPEGLASATKYCIIIDSKNQAVNIFSGYANHWNFIRTMSCSTGAAETPTIKGMFEVQARGEMFRASKDTICKYYTGFSGNYLFHTILLNNDGSIQDPTLGIPVSHGCTRLAINDAMYIYYNIPKGTKVWSE